MLPFVLYFVAAMVTGFHLYSLLSLIVYGAGFNLLEVTALFGSFLLLIAAYVSLFKPRVAAQIALVGALTLWCFYGPALANLARSKLAKRTTTSQYMGRIPQFMPSMSGWPIPGMNHLSLLPRSPSEHPTDNRC